MSEKNCVNWQVKEPEQKNDFSSAESGQKLYSLAFGEITVRGISGGYIHSTRINTNWRLNGKNHWDHQDLFWRKPEIEFIPDPVRKVKNEFVKYMNIWFAAEGRELPWAIHDTEEIAEHLARCCPAREYLKIAHKITIPYEIEE